MRQLVTILAIFSILATAPVSATEDPFDFSSPLPNNSPERRDAKYFSRAPRGQATDHQSTGEAERSPSRYQREPSTQASRQPSGSAADLFSEQGESRTEDRPPTVSFSREMARERQTSRQQAPQQSDPQDTLRRFDEFLKSRDVISADYSKPADQQERTAIRQVQGAEGERSFNDLPSFGDLDTLPTDAAGTVRSPQIPLFKMQTDPQPQTKPAVRPRQERLTDPIPTGDSPSTLPTRKSDSVSIEPATHLFEKPNSAARSPQRTYARTQLPSHTDSTSRSADSEAPSVQTSWTLLSPINLGQQCTAELKLTNPGDEDADRVSLEVRVPSSIQIINATPAPVEDRAFLGWKFSELPAGEERTIQIVFVPTSAGSVELSSHVRHTSSRSELFSVAQPRLDVALSGPNKVHVGEPASQTVIVTNQGTGMATNVKLQAIIPAGLEHAEGEHLFMEIGSLNPGEVRSMRLVMGAVAGGNHIVQVKADADSGLVRTAAAEVTVIAPSLKAAMNGPSLRYLGREAEYLIRVHNDGVSATDFVQVTHRVPEGFDFVSAQRGVKFDAATRLIHWYVGALESSETRELSIRLIARQIGEFVHEVHASSEHGAKADAQLTTRIEGTASLVVEVADLEDPVEVGSETAYEITVTNEGTVAAHSVGLTCEIPRGLSLVDAQGPSDHRVQDGMVGFRPIDNLPAGKSLTYHVFVKGGAAGDQRFRCRLTSESLSQPLFSEELTKFYAE